MAIVSRDIATLDDALAVVPSSSTAASVKSVGRRFVVRGCGGGGVMPRRI
jgi:hypothetical protein